MRTEDQKENAAKKLIQTGKQQDSKRYDDFSTTAEEERESKRIPRIECKGKHHLHKARTICRHQ